MIFGQLPSNGNEAPRRKLRGMRIMNQKLSPMVAEINFRVYRETSPPSAYLQGQESTASNFRPTRVRLSIRQSLHAAIQSIRCAITHNARAFVGLNNAPATFVSGELRLGAVAAKAAQRKLRKALDLLREPYVPHPGNKAWMPRTAQISKAQGPKGVPRLDPHNLLPALP